MVKRNMPDIVLWNVDSTEKEIAQQADAESSFRIGLLWSWKECAIAVSCGTIEIEWCRYQCLHMHSDTPRKQQKSSRKGKRK